MVCLGFGGGELGGELAFSDVFAGRRWGHTVMRDSNNMIIKWPIPFDCGSETRPKP